MTNDRHVCCVVESDLPEGITLAEYRRIRGYAAEHPKLSIEQVANAIGVDVALVCLAYAGAGAIVECEDPEEEADRHA